jgi:transcriptional regulator with XRE-family HTH domain
MRKGARKMGQKLYELREARGLTQGELAAMAGLPVGSLRNWEQGLRLPQLDAAWQLAQALGISLDTLAGGVFEGRGKPAPPRPRGRPRKHHGGPSGEKKGKGRKAKGE